ncbi:uncharacterized protein CBL_06774 [Carabus blaptoides fortunei]
MLPLSLLRTAQNHPMLVELKNGETYNGHLVSCDNWMNINLREVICTSRDGDKFWKMPECYIRGSTIKYLRIPDEVIDMVKEESMVKNRGRDLKGGRGGGGGQAQRGGRPAGRGTFGGRGGRGGTIGGRNPAFQNKKQKEIISSNARQIFHKMFKKQSATVAEKQSCFTPEQILSDIQAITKASRLDDEHSASGKHEEWYVKLKEFDSVSHSLIAALDDGADLRDQLLVLEKEIKKSADDIRRQVQETLQATKSLQ